MRQILLLISIFWILNISHIQAQDVDQIIDKYLESVGGKSMLRQLKGMKINATFKQSGLEFPFRQVIMTDGRQYSEVNITGSYTKQQAYDGEVLWTLDFASGKAVKSDNEATANFKLNIICL